MMIRFSMNIDRYRRGQLGMHQVGIRRLVAGESATSLIGATGLGKSDVIRNLGLELYCRDIICTSLILEPNGYLRDQMFDPDKITDWKNRYSIHCDHEVRWDRI